MKRFSDTLSVHAGREDLSQLRVHAAPIDFSTTYPLQELDEAAADLGAMALGDKPTGNPVYARLHNPPVARFEDAMATLEQGTRASPTPPGWQP